MREIYDDDIQDYELDFVSKLFTLFDEQLEAIRCQFHQCPDPNRYRLSDEAEHVAGMGFVVCQRYLTSVIKALTLPRNVALGIGPFHEGGETYANIFNAAADYWKHIDEWDVDATRARDVSLLSDRRQRTMRILESVTGWSDYACIDLLCELTPRTRFTELLPVLVAWCEKAAAFSVADR